MRVESGQIYFKLDGSVNSKEELNKFFEQFGFKYKKINIDKYGFTRQTEFDNGLGLKFSIVWYVNRAYVRIGSWNNGYVDVPFTLISGSWLQDVDRATFQFCDDDEKTATLSIPYQNFEKEEV